jgi:hypothetical protein
MASGPWLSDLKEISEVKKLNYFYKRGKPQCSKGNKIYDVN